MKRSLGLTDVNNNAIYALCPNCLCGMFEFTKPFIAPVPGDMFSGVCSECKTPVLVYYDHKDEGTRVNFPKNNQDIINIYYKGFINTRTLTQ